jgi:hypothetical protein
VIAAAAVVVVVLVIAVRFPSQTPTPQQASQAPPGGSSQGAPDISTLSPRQQADRLFDLIMTSAEAGDTGRVAFHTTMALQAYGMLGELDDDARYHVGMIHLVRGETTEALSQADTIENAVPGHLLAIMLRHTAAQISQDSVAIRGAYQRFLENYEREKAVTRPEYEIHGRSIDAFLTEARQAAGGTGP